MFVVRSIQIHAPRSGALVVALIVGVFHGAFDEESGLATGLPDLQTILVFEQVAALAVTPSRGWFPTVPAQDLHACRAHVAHRVITASENPVAGGADPTAVLLLDRFSSSAWCIDQDACCGMFGGLHIGGGGIRRTATDVDLLWGRISISLWSEWGRIGSTRTEISSTFERKK